MTKQGFLSLFFCFWVLCLPRAAAAQTCNASASAISFGNFSPIAQGVVDTAGTITVTCTWPSVSTTPNAQACLNLAAARPRQLKHGHDLLQYDLYQDPGHALAWGAVSTGTSPISPTLTKPPTGASASQSVTVYGRIAANQPTVSTVGDSSTAYSESFGGNVATLSYGFYRLSAPGCSALPSTAHFSFGVSATVVNDCTISATNVNFGTASGTTTALNATGAIAVRCTNGDAWRVALDAGTSGQITARKMQRSGGGGTVGYGLYTSMAHSTVWGDGTAGTSMQTGTGSGNMDVLTLYGYVPAQATPLPGTYSDTITATIAF